MKRRTLLSFLLVLFFGIICNAKGYKISEYSLNGAGTGTNGSYLIRVTGVFKDAKKRHDDLKMCAVHGVMFRGFDATNGAPSQSPLIKDANVEETKSAFFEAFFAEGKYRNFCTLRESSIQSVKIKGGYEVSALILVDKDRLYKLLEENGIIQGFSNLW